MKKLHVLILIAYATAAFPLHAENLQNANQTESQSIESEISSLEEELATLRKNLLNKEIHAQPYMIDNWHEFAQDINETEESEKEILAVKKRIEVLKERKASLSIDPVSK